MKKVFGMIAALTVTVSGVTSAGAATVYVESNRGDHNSILSYELGSSGALTPGATYDTGGKGVVDPSLALGPFDSDQQIILNAEKTLLLAVNSGSNSIAVFNVAANGSLKPVAGSPFDSHGINPVSLGLKGNILTVVNKHQDPAQAADGSLPNYTTFELEDSGQLRWTGSVVPIAAGSSPSQALVAPWAPLVFGADFLGGLVRSFSLNDNGSLSVVSTLGLPADAFPNSNTPRFPLGLAANPVHDLVYVGLPTANRIATYSYNSSGALSFKGTTADSGAVVCWLLTNAEGTRLFASNTADPSISVYDIASNPEAPRELQKLKLASLGGAYQIALSPDEKQLLVLTQRFQATTPLNAGNEIHVINLGSEGSMLSETLTPLTLDLPPNIRPQGIAIH
jgi:6-phosphogluconolactonase (cycloisomerase 2 family)